MAAQDYTAVVQQLYVSYFGRPADYFGLQNFSAQLAAMKAPTDFASVQAAVQADKAGTSALSKLVNSFNSSPESAALYGTDNSQVGVAKFVNAIYQNILGRDADISGFNFWVSAITSGTLTRANAAAAITQAALTNTSDQGKLDALTVSNKLAVATAFTNDIDTPAEITGYSGDAAATAARGLLASVNNTTNVTAFQATVDSTLQTIVAGPGQTYSLTSGVDTLVGTAGNDVFNATVTGTTAAPATFGAFDSINGGAGINSLSIVDTSATGQISLPTNVTINNIQNLNVSTTSAGGASIDASGIASVNSVKLSTTDTTGTAVDVVKANAASAVSVTSASGSVAVDGGTSVTVNAKGAVTIGGTTAPTGAVNVTASNAAATAANATAGTITITGGSTVTVNETLVAPTVTGTTGTAYSETGATVTVNGTSSTTSVSVTQTAAVTAKAGVAGVTAVAAVKQVDTVAIGGTVATNDQFSVTVGATTYTYTAVAGDTAATVATGLAALVTAASGVTAAASGANITLTANTAGTAFTSSAATTGAAATAGDSTTTANVVAVTGVAAVAAVGGIVDGAVMITDANSANTDGTKANTITTVTLDGYGAGSTIKSNALTSLTLANSAKDVVVTDNTATPTNTTLNVTVNKLASGATLTDNTVKTLNITAAGDSTLAVNATADTKLTVAGAGKATLNLAGATKLATVDASVATGAVALSGLGAKVTSVTTGSGNDTVALTTLTNAAVAATDTTAAVAAVNATVSTGAGNDSIDVTGITGNGNFTVTAGDGNDSIKVGQGQLVAGNTIDGGAGTDTLVLNASAASTNYSAAAFAAGDYAVINSLVSNVEGVEFAQNVVGVDASQMAFTSLTFDLGGTVTGVTTQSLSTAANLIATASGDKVDLTNGSTYAGNLNVTDTKTAQLTLNADTATVNVKASTSAATTATIVGDLHTSLTVNLTGAANNATAANVTGDNVASAVINLSSTANSTLKSIVLTGTGNVSVDASAGGSLTSIDASQLGGAVANGSSKGAIAYGLTFHGNAANAETITLGAGHDTVYAASTYGALDTIVGFDAVKEGSTAASTSDVLVISGTQIGGSAADLTLDGLHALVTSTSHVAGISSLTLGAGDTSLALAFVHAASAATSGNIVEFQFGGNTYLFADTNGNHTLDNTDFAIKLVGTVDVAGAFGVPPATA